jgi:hypothetical protein
MMKRIVPVEMGAPEPLLSTITASVIPMLTVEFTSFPDDGSDAVRKDAFLWLRSKRQDLGVFTGMKLDEASVIVTRVGGSRLLASYVAAGQWVKR